MARQVSKNTKIKNLIQDIKAEYLEQAKRLAEEIVFMQDMLDKARNDFKDEGLIDYYDNGGGQKGTRENPAIAAYQKLLKNYMAALDSLNELKEKSIDKDNSRELIGLFDWR